MSGMIDWIAAEAERVEESGVVRRRGRFSHESIEDLPGHRFPGRSQGLGFTTEDTEGHRGNQNPHSVSPNTGETRVGHPESSESPGIGNPNLGEEDSVSGLS